MEILQTAQQEKQQFYTLSQVKMLNKMVKALYSLKADNRKQLKIIDYCIEHNLPSNNFLPFTIEEYAKHFKPSL